MQCGEPLAAQSLPFRCIAVNPPRLRGRPTPSHALERQLRRPLAPPPRTPHPSAAAGGGGAWPARGAAVAVGAWPVRRDAGRCVVRSVRRRCRSRCPSVSTSLAECPSPVSLLRRQAEETSPSPGPGPGGRAASAARPGAAQPPSSSLPPPQVRARPRGRGAAPWSGGRGRRLAGVSVFTIRGYVVLPA